MLSIGGGRGTPRFFRPAQRTDGTQSGARARPAGRRRQREGNIRVQARSRPGFSRFRLKRRARWAALTHRAPGTANRRDAVRRSRPSGRSPEAKGRQYPRSGALAPGLFAVPAEKARPMGSSHPPGARHSEPTGRSQALAPVRPVAGGKGTAIPAFRRARAAREKRTG